jgi:CTP:molybdopterin cytidylyltransferase MocA
MTGTFIALLAAGKASRFGGGKLDALLQGRPVGAWSLAAGQTLSEPLGEPLGAPLVVITGKERPEFVPEDCRVAPNPEAVLGMGTSIRLAARLAREAGAGRLLVMLADMPFVSSETLRKLLAAEGAAACVHPAGVMGPPACFPSALFPALEALPPERGAGALLKGLAGVALISPPPRELIDIDTRQDLLDAAAL